MRLAYILQKKGIAPLTVSESCVDTALCGDSVGSGGEELGDAGSVETSLCKTESCSQTRSTSTNDDGVIPGKRQKRGVSWPCHSIVSSCTRCSLMVNDGVPLGSVEWRRSLLCSERLRGDDLPRDGGGVKESATRGGGGGRRGGSGGERRVCAGHGPCEASSNHDEKLSDAFEYLGAFSLHLERTRAGKCKENKMIDDATRWVVSKSLDAGRAEEVEMEREGKPHCSSAACHRAHPGRTASHL